MYRLTIVDDDEMLRRGLVQSVDWTRHGFEVVAQAAGGKGVLCKIDKSTPQLIVTGIQMPVMDGLQLIETISRLYPEVKVVPLIAYEEFRYARKALEYKVSQHVLKYEGQDAVLDAVLQAARQIETESESRLLRGKSLDIQRRNFFREISCNKMELGEIQAQAGCLGVSLSCGRCRMALSRIESLKTMDEIPFLIQTKEWFHAIEEAIRAVCREAGHDLSFLQGKEYSNAVIMEGENEPRRSREEIQSNGRPDPQDLPGDAMSRPTNRLNIHLYAGIGRWYDTINRIHDFYMEALKINSLRDMLDREYPERQYPILGYSPYMSAEEMAGELVGKMSSYTNMCLAKTDLSLERIADQVHLSANYVSTLFKKHPGMNISDYITKIRMEHTASPPSAANFKTYEIAERVGYINSQYSSVLFKKFYGMTPKEYRNQNKI